MKKTFKNGSTITFGYVPPEKRYKSVSTPSKKTEKDMAYELYKRARLETHNQ